SDLEGLGAQRGQGTLRSGEVLLQLGGQPQMARGAPRFRPRDGVVAAGAAFRWGHRSASTSSSPHPKALPGPTPSASSRVSASWLVTVAVPANATRVRVMGLLPSRGRPVQDRKSTRLNSSHVKISYAVFCSKQKSDRT